MALGLGQNLKRVRFVIHMGRSDPAAIVQMVGRCGRDGNVGLGLLFMEPSRKNGRNNVGDFEEGMVQNDDARMDALAVTPLCLRIALALDNKIGYIPLLVNDPNYLAEQKREQSLGFAKCKFSNCFPDEAESLMKAIQHVNAHNFDDILNDPTIIKNNQPIITMKRKRRQNQYGKGSCQYPTNVAENLEKHLVHQFEMFYIRLLGPKPEFPASVFFNITQAKAIVGLIDQVLQGRDYDAGRIEHLIGGQMFEGQVESLKLSIAEWILSDYYQLHLVKLAELDQFTEQEGVQIQAEMEAELLRLQAISAAQFLADKNAKAAEKKMTKDRLAEERAALRLRLADDCAAEKQRLSDEKTAKKLRIAEEKKAEGIRASQIRASENVRSAQAQLNKNKKVLNDSTVEDHTINNNGAAEDYEDQSKSPDRARLAEEINSELKEEANARAIRRSKANEERAEKFSLISEQKKRRRQSIEDKKYQAQASREVRERKIFVNKQRQNHNRQVIEEMRANLLNADINCSPDQSSSGT
ncbi:hypothetical protein PCANC_03167 [Puccinia coronata f. sp. avenae]|uniref:Helicase C-terminal domain-containing protein n=1 Tax=Puccinia coronata f. sp. avenae TaxID=200324 RepID=A0A2N5T818_9BASI|nr:hypothetical protein PCANC_03167 [Puccinia coronata f. sp. avenae]